MGNQAIEKHGSGSSLSLPKWNEPRNLEKARLEILNLGRSMHEHAYLVGRHLIWARDKIGTTEFEAWVESELWFGVRTAERMIAFCKRCEALGALSPYEPSKTGDTVTPDAPPLPLGKYRVLYADPPWAYRNSGFDQSAASEYQTMEVEAIAALPVRDLIEGNAVLFLWVTSPILPAGLQVMSAWGFEYKASLVWEKDRAPGMGWWVNSKHEYLLVGSCGDVGTPREKPDSIFRHPVGKHSEKPPIVRSMIESMFAVPYLEMFARSNCEGWTSWGNEV